MPSQLHALRVALVGLVLALLSCAASAAFTPGTWYVSTYRPLGLFATPELACANLSSVVSADNSGRSAWYSNVDGNNFCTEGRPSESQYATRRGIVQDTAACPDNSTLVGGQCQCAAGYLEQNNQCVMKPPSNCVGGVPKTVNFTTGWTRTGSTGIIPDSDFVGKVSMPGISYKSSCVAGCTYSIGVDATTNTYVSTVPSAQGLYRNSVDALVVGTGEKCTVGTDASDTAAIPDPAPAPCPGFVGQVNGKTTCVGTATSPLPKPSGDVEANARNLNSNGDNGNPAAGEKPATGEGSGTGGVGRTPGTGVGTGSGGPIDAAAGGKGSANGTTNKPAEGKEQQNCGAPGQPKCALDETGTPSPYDKDKYSSALDSAKSEADAARNTIGGTSDKGFLEGFRSSLVSAPPVVGCVAIELPKDMGAINPCPVVDGVRAVMAYLWAAAALFLCFRMIKQVI